MSFLDRRYRLVFTILILVYSLVFLAILYEIPLTIFAISDIAQTLLTVEGILLGLTPLIEKPRHRVLPLSVGTLSVLVSLITVVMSESAKTTGFGCPYNWILVFLDAEVFIIMLGVYYSSAMRRSFRRRGP